MLDPPTAAPAETVIVIVDEPEPGAAIDVGENDTVTPDGCPDADRETAELKPPEIVVVTVDGPDDPWAIETEDGEAEIAKSGVGGAPPQLLARAFASTEPSPVARSYPVPHEKP